MPLLWVLRDILNLKRHQVRLRRRTVRRLHRPPRRATVRACLVSAKDIGAQKITTIEGISAAATHPVQRAWQEIDVPQCGYCQAGQIMSAVALLNEKPSPTDADIADAMSGNLCRCGTYLRIRAAIKKAAALAREGSSVVAGRGGQMQEVQ
jgi:isoquinoline 1-oxidoreductase alpha subunit